MDVEYNSLLIIARAAATLVIVGWGFPFCPGIFYSRVAVMLHMRGAAFYFRPVLRFRLKLIFRILEEIDCRIPSLILRLQ